MKPIFCGNFEYDARQSEIERLFSKYGRVDRVDMKSGFAFVYMDDERDAEDAIRGLDRREFGRQGRRLRVEWTNQERGGRSASSKKSSANSRPSKTLFVINFDPVNTRTRDLEGHFEPYGKILNVRIRRNFAFVQFELQEDATKALQATNMSKLIDRIITVEYSARDDDANNRNGHSPNRRGRGSPLDRRGRDRDRGERVIERGSPDYGCGPSPYSKPDSGSNSRSNGAEVESPDYDRYRSRSPSRQD
ncbi:Arginine/serine-rich-splicing factor RSP41 [Platanthera zijinensis]|uniref:Arginine/serine-rich-splicing factor RSP41 n=1 Tax=Platanthera zijinensis TaxID=2320716 RepID=A0AAP0BZJ8_9ASPA